LAGRRFGRNLVFIIMGYSTNAFKKLGAVSRTVDAGSWALSGVLMIGAQWVLGTAP
jgi:hypothetical protein